MGKIRNFVISTETLTGGVGVSDQVHLDENRSFSNDLVRHLFVNYFFKLASVIINRSYDGK